VELEERLRDRTAWSTEGRCSIAKTLDVLSTRTAFLVVRECFYGTTRFDDFVTRTGTSAPAVSRALKQLEQTGVVGRAPYRAPGSRPRAEYRLTPAGEELLPVLLSLMQWGDKHLQDGHPPLLFTRDGDLSTVTVTVTTPDGEPVPSGEILIRAND
jgi:DNA-binding HxlR family transcriptional regulator